MSTIRLLDLPGRCVPDPHKVVIAASSDSIAARQPDDVLNPILEVRSLKVVDVQPCIGVKCLYVAFPVSHDKAHPIGGPCHSKDTTAGIVAADGSPQVRAIARMRCKSQNTISYARFHQPCQGAAGCRKPSHFQQRAAREAASLRDRCGRLL